MNDSVNKPILDRAYCRIVDINKFEYIEDMPLKALIPLLSSLLKEDSDATFVVSTKQTYHRDDPCEGEAYVSIKIGERVETVEEYNFRAERTLNDVFGYKVVELMTYEQRRDWWLFGIRPTHLAIKDIK